MENQAENEEEMFKYLDDLRAGGTINMFGAAPYLQRTYFLDPSTARTVLAKWMTTFATRHPER